MNTGRHGPDEERAADDAATGLPLLRTWRDVYIFVVLTFYVWVAALVLLRFLFS